MFGGLDPYSHVSIEISYRAIYFNPPANCETSTAWLHAWQLKLGSATNPIHAEKANAKRGWGHNTSHSAESLSHPHHIIDAVIQ